MTKPVLTDDIGRDLRTTDYHLNAIERRIHQVDTESMKQPVPMTNGNGVIWNGTQWVDTNLYITNNPFEATSLKSSRDTVGAAQNIEIVGDSGANKISANASESNKKLLQIQSVHNSGGTPAGVLGIQFRTGAASAPTTVGQFDEAGKFFLGTAQGKTTLNLSSTGADTGLTIGGDSNLYRRAASQLATDDDLAVGAKTSYNDLANAGAYLDASGFMGFTRTAGIILFGGITGGTQGRTYIYNDGRFFLGGGVVAPDFGFEWKGTHSAGGAAGPVAGDFLTENLVSSLPTSPVEGMVINYQNAAMAPNGVAWRFRYRNSANTYDWDFVGGSPMMSEQTSGGTQNSGGAGTYIAMTGTPSIVVPLSGVYEVTFIGQLMSQATGNHDIRVRAYENTTAVGGIAYGVVGTQFEVFSYSMTTRVVLVAGRTLTLRLANSLAAGVTSAQVTFTTMRLQPVAVG